MVGDTGWMDEDFSEVVFRPVDDVAVESSLSVEGTDRSTGVRDGLVAVGAFVLVVLIVGFVFYDRGDGEWQMTIGAEAPISSRTGHVSVWTGRELVVWGGWRTTSDPGLLETLDDGAAYDPATDTWRLLSPSPLVGRVGAGVVWTGTEMLVLATQQGGVLPTRNGAAYNPATDTWRILPEFDHTLASPISSSAMKVMVSSLRYPSRQRSNGIVGLIVDTTEAAGRGPGSDHFSACCSWTRPAGRGSRT